VNLRKEVHLLKNHLSMLKVFHSRLSELKTEKERSDFVKKYQKRCSQVVEEMESSVKRISAHGRKEKSCNG